MQPVEKLTSDKKFFIEIQNHQKTWKWIKMDKIITNTVSNGILW